MKSKLPKKFAVAKKNFAAVILTAQTISKPDSVRVTIFFIL